MKNIKKKLIVLLIILALLLLVFFPYTLRISVNNTEYILTNKDSTIILEEGSYFISGLSNRMCDLYSTSKDGYIQGKNGCPFYIAEDVEKKLPVSQKKVLKVEKVNYSIKNMMGSQSHLKTQMDDMKELDNFNSSLTYSISIDYSGNKLYNLEEFSNIEDLAIYGSEVQKIEGLEGLKNLKKLNLSDNKITKIEGLGELESLENLDLSKNEITKIENIEEMENLQYLSVQENDIKSISQESYQFIKENEITVEGVNIDDLEIQ